MIKFNSSIIILILLFSCQQTTKQTKASVNHSDTTRYLDSIRIVKDWEDVATDSDTTYSLCAYIVKLKDGLDSVRAIINDSTMFIARKGQLMSTMFVAHKGKLTPDNGGDVSIADGCFGYIQPEQLVRVDTPCFKFNFSKEKFNYDKDDELSQLAERAEIDLNSLVKRIQNKDSEALLQFYRLGDGADGHAGESLPYVFWELINLWTDKELSAFISTLSKFEKKGFCKLLIKSSLCNPYEYYKLYYPRTLEQIEKTI